jgi:PAT family beta-lactamase induction signal transducer AmpG
MDGPTAPALGSGYTVFFIYSALVGVFAVVLAFIVAARQGKPEVGVKRPAEAHS